MQQIFTAPKHSLTVLVLGSLWRACRNPSRVGLQAMRGLPKFSSQGLSNHEAPAPDVLVI
jgi:hypothetical protein